jgi:hypothetical protein
LARRRACSRRADAPGDPASTSPAVGPASAGISDGSPLSATTPSSDEADAPLSTGQLTQRTVFVDRSYTATAPADNAWPQQRHTPAYRNRIVFSLDRAACSLISLPLAATVPGKTCEMVPSRHIALCGWSSCSGQD